MLLRIEVHPGRLLLGVNLSLATLLLWAAKEAGMSIEARHRIAALWRIGMNPKERV